MPLRTILSKAFNKLVGRSEREPDSALPKVIVVSTRVPAPDKPISGGMAPAVRDALAGVSEKIWFGLRNGRPPKAGDLSAEFASAVKIDEHGWSYEKDGIDVVELSSEGHEWDGHYNKFSNGFLWPLCHDRPDLTEVPDDDAKKANYILNERLAIQIRDELTKDNDTRTPVWVHDYHHMNLPTLLRQQGVTNPVIFFNHIPLPEDKTLQELGEEGAREFKEYIGGLRDADAVMLQSSETANRFMRLIGENTPRNPLDVYETTTLDVNGRDLVVGNFPISINVEKIEGFAHLGGLSDDANTKELADQLKAETIFIEFCRADYSKGVTDRIKAFRKLIEDHPELKGQAQLVVGAEPTRTDIPAYIDYANEVKALAKELNDQKDLHVDGAPPVVFLNKTIPLSDLVQLFRNDGNKPGQRKIATITAWRDGMNLVCKEAMMAQDPENAGVLVLSYGAGAAHEEGFAKHALRYTPDRNDPSELADTMYQAILMPQDEANARAKAGQAHIREYDLGKWANETISVMEKVAHSRNISAIEQDNQPPQLNVQFG
jgi:trehalose 6-phosphate synthase